MAEERKTSLTKRDVNRVIARWYITTEMSLNYERMQSIAYTYALIPALKKLYPNKEDMIPALQRHLELFNTNATAGGLILGTTLAMEEEKANNPDAIPSESIVAVKTGLMGPVAALGDSFSAGTITTLFILASCSLAQGGSIAGFWLLLLGTMYTLGELIIFTKMTYTKGRSAIKDIMSSKLMSNIIEGANILGMAMMGALTASMVNLAVAITANFERTGKNRRYHAGYSVHRCVVYLLLSDQQKACQCSEACLLHHCDCTALCRNRIVLNT